jgi:hypothetical protein
MNDNFIKITGHLYKVKNQNGLNNALYNYFDVDDDIIRKKAIREMVQSIPPYYPICFVIVDLSFECGRVYLEFFNLNEEALNIFNECE